MRDTHQFESLADVAEYVANTPREIRTNQSERASACALTQWEAIEIARTGGRHATDVERLKSAMLAMPSTQIIETHSPSVTSDLVGFSPVVPNAMMGLPDSMLNMLPTPDPMPVIKIGVHVGRASNVNEKTVFNRAAVILSALDVLHAQGRKTELWACWRNESNPRTQAFFDVLLKPASALWDYEAASFCFGNPAMQRRLFWAVAERYGEASKGVARDSYGHEACGAEEGFDVYFPRMRERLNTIGEAKRDVTRYLAEQGLEVSFE